MKGKKGVKVREYIGCMWWWWFQGQGPEDSKGWVQSWAPLNSAEWGDWAPRKWRFPSGPPWAPTSKEPGQKGPNQRNGEPRLSQPGNSTPTIVHSAWSHLPASTIWNQGKKTTPRLLIRRVGEESEDKNEVLSAGGGAEWEVKGAWGRRGPEGSHGWW